MYRMTLLAKDAGIYEVCSKALLMSGDAPPVDRWDEYVSLIKKLKSIGVPDAPIKGIQMYRLDKDAELVLERSEMNILRERVNKPIWTPAILEQVTATRDFLASAADENGVK